MQLGPGDWSVVITGNTNRFLSAGGRNREILRHQLEQLVAGYKFSPDELDYWGISVRVLGPDNEIITVPSDA